MCQLTDNILRKALPKSYQVRGFPNITAKNETITSSHAIASIGVTLGNLLKNKDSATNATSFTRILPKPLDQ